jgi:nuclear transport factor 2 (NTF2) superfamily protein
MSIDQVSAIHAAKHAMIHGTDDVKRDVVTDYYLGNQIQFVMDASWVRRANGIIVITVKTYQPNTLKVRYALRYYENGDRQFFARKFGHI